MKSNTWYVSRQHYYYSGIRVVEIAYGGSDYANPDQLVVKYGSLGEGKEFNDPREAVKAAIAIRLAWQQDSTKHPFVTPVEGDEDYEQIQMAVGCTMGFSLEFEPEAAEELIAWADRVWESMPKCDRCGDVIDDDPITLAEPFDYTDDMFCSEWCADRAYEDMSLDSFLMQLLDENPADEDEIYSNEYSVAYINPTESEQRRLSYCGTFAEVKARFWQEWRALTTPVEVASA